MTIPATSTPPAPRDPWEAKRWLESRRRWRMLTGEWTQDLRDRMRTALGSVRAEAVGEPDLSSNVLATVSRQLSILHDQEPKVRHDNQRAADLVAEAMSDAGWLPTMQQFVADLVALRDMPMRVDVGGDPARPSLLFRPMRPDLVVGWSNADAPDVLVGIREARKARDGRWFWEVLDVSDSKNPRYYAETDSGEDISDAVLGGSFSGESYPYRLADGTPFLPVWLYHAAKRPYLWDYATGIEVVEGTLQAGLAMSFWMHCLRSASWPQRWMLGCEPAGADYADEDGDGYGRKDVVADPAAVLILQPSQDVQGGAQTGQWAASADVAGTLDAVIRYEQRVATFAGVSASDFVRTSGDPRSGYALSISQAGKRQAARKLEPTISEGDERVIGICAALLNLWSKRDGGPGLGLPESGYEIEYTSLGLTPDEIAAKRESVLALLDKGLISKAEARAELMGESVDEAARKLAAVPEPTRPEPVTDDGMPLADVPTD